MSPLSSTAPYQPIISPAESARFASFFGPLAIGGRAPLDRVRVFMSRSQLPAVDIERVLRLADVDGDGQMDVNQFTVAMKIVNDVIAKVIPAVPAVLPSTLKMAATTTANTAGIGANRINLMDEPLQPAPVQTQPPSMFNYVASGLAVRLRLCPLIG